MSAPNHRDTDVTQFLQDLDGGVFVQKIGQALSEIAGGVIDHDKAGKLTLTFDITRLGNAYKAVVKHKIAYTVPTARGKASEEETTDSAMHVGTGGRMTMFPENQNQMFTRTGEPHPTNRED